MHEKGDNGTKKYYTAWNSYICHALEEESLFAIQNAGSAGKSYWKISGSVVSQETEIQNEYPFRIKSSIHSDINKPNELENKVSLIAPYYSINNSTLILGTNIFIEEGGNLKLRPSTVKDIPQGEWLWSDKSNESSLVINDIRKGGVFNVKYSYVDNDIIYESYITYNVILKQDNYKMPEGIYRIQRESDKYYLTTNESLIPVFSNLCDNENLQLWSISRANIAKNPLVFAFVDWKP